jgi:Flp pilus assembly protein TadD
MIEAADLYCTAIGVSTVGAGDIYNNLGLTLGQLGRPQEAIAALLKAVELSPASPEGWFNLGRRVAGTGDVKAAEPCLARAISINPLYSEAHIELGNLRHREGRLEDAVACYHVAIEVAPANAVAWNNLGAALSELGRHEDAEAAYRQAIALRPDYDEAYFNLGKELGVLGDDEAEMAMLQQAIVLNASNASAHTQIGVVLLHRGLLEDAAEAFRTSLTLDASSLITRSNLGMVLSLLSDPRGLEILESVVQEKPESAEDRWGGGARLLLGGRYEEGWREYEWRKRVGRFVSQHPVLPEPLWTGEPLDGKTILLHAEQGQGDTIQFARYARLVAERGGRVVLEVQRSLHRLLDGIPGVWRCVARGDSLPPFDTYAPLMSLPYLFGTRLDSVPLPVAPVVAARPVSGDAGRLKVGLVWAGNPKDKRDRLRSSRLADWAGLAGIDGVEFTSLQTDEAASQIEGGPFAFVSDVSSVKDFADTAAIVANLDLVITVDTAMAHLAGSLGKPVWVLIYNVTDWRWGRTGDKTPWYPTARLFRQTTPADWTQVLGEIEASLRELVANKE